MLREPVDRQSTANLRTFLIIWVGQLASILGSEMTSFAVTIWAWEVAGQATPLTLIFFFAHTPKVIASIFAGVLVDRFSRRIMMIVGDTVAGSSTLAILLLLWSGHLQIWHLYLTASINGLFGYFQELAYTSSISMIVPKQHYVRANALRNHLSHFGSNIIAPALAGGLYYLIGLSGILAIDLATFMMAVTMVGLVRIPQPPQQKNHQQSKQSLRQELTFGFRYIFVRPGLLAILIFLLSFNLIGTASSAIFSPMILARSENNEAVLASVLSVAGIGGFIGAVIISIWGGPKRRIHGLLLGAAFSCLSRLVLGLSIAPVVWMTAGFFESFFSPFLGTSNGAIWLSKVDPAVQGRVFSSRYFIAQMTSPIGLAIAGPLADYVFEPAMMPGGILERIFGGIFGTGEGAGMALQYTLFAFCGVLIGFGGYAFPLLRNVEAVAPNQDQDLRENHNN